MQRVLLPIFLVLVIGCAGHDTNDYIGNAFLGAPYISDPLGEGVVPDNDPIIRFDAFDCTTFVETSLAGGDAQKLNKIRYRDGVPNFINRNHFIETDWNEDYHNPLSALPIEVQQNRKAPVCLYKQEFRAFTACQSSVCSRSHQGNDN